MLRISEQLQQALTEGIQNDADLMRTLNTLAKQGGTWKSEKQARFLLDTIDGPRWEAGPPAEKWAKQNRMGGEYLVFAVHSLEGFGRKTASKIRYTARLYALDGGGIVSVAKVPYRHATKASQGFHPDWDRAEIVFHRTKKPSIVIDPRGERAAAAKENAPMIAKLKMIPNWEDKRIIVSFIGQLEAGGKLSIKQMGIVNSMLPPDQVERGDVQHWKEQYAKFQDLLTQKVLPAIAKEAIEHEKERIKEWENADEQRRWLLSEPDMENVIGYYKKPIQDIKKQGFADSWSIVSAVVYDILETTRARLPEYESEIIHKQMMRALKPKPTKKSLQYLDFVLRAVKVMEEKPASYWVQKRFA